MDKKKTALVLRISALWLAIMTLFMGFGAGIGEEKTTSGISIFDYTFGKGIFDGAKDAGIKLHNAGMIIAFVLILIAIIALIALVIMNAKQVGTSKAKTIIAAIVAVMLVVCAILYFCTKAFAKKIDGWEEVMPNPKLGAGAICAGLFGLFGAGALVGSIVLDKE